MTIEATQRKSDGTQQCRLWPALPRDVLHPACTKVSAAETSRLQDCKNCAHVWICICSVDGWLELGWPCQLGSQLSNVVLGAPSCDMTPPRCRQCPSAPQAQSGRVLLGKTVHMLHGVKQEQAAHHHATRDYHVHVSQLAHPRAVTATQAHIVHTLRTVAPFFSPLTPWIARTYSAAAAADVPAATTPSGPAPSDVAREVAGDTMEVLAARAHTLHCITLPENAPESHPLFRADR